MATLPSTPVLLANISRSFQVTPEECSMLQEHAALFYTPTLREILRNMARGLSAFRGFQTRATPNRVRTGKGVFDAWVRATGPVSKGGDLSQLHPALAKALSPVNQAKLRAMRGQAAALSVLLAVEHGACAEVVKSYVRRAMQVTPQGKASVWHHCVATRTAVIKLESVLYGAPIPVNSGWLADFTPLLTRALGRSYVDNRPHLLRYLEWHDCAKPLCITADDDGRFHFSQHEELSAALWRACGGTPLECLLMAQDMDLHRLSAAELPEFCARPHSKLLALSSIASVWANCEDFGGVESTSFKAKKKHLLRRLTQWAKT